MDSRALLFLEYPDFILFFLLLTFIKKLFLHCYSPGFIDYFMPDALIQIIPAQVLLWVVKILFGGLVFFTNHAQ